MKITSYKKIRKIILTVLISGFIIYMISGGLIYFNQEKLIFHTNVLAANHNFDFRENFEEINIPTADGNTLNTLLFKCNNPKGVVFYLHGNAGNLQGWGVNARKFLEHDHDVFMLDYRGFGKSTGSIESEEQFLKDVQLVYDTLRSRYEENKITVLGYSIGTAPAAKISADNHPKRLILNAPYYSLNDLIAHNPNFGFTSIFPISLLLKYELPNYRFLADCKVPITIFHGKDDKLIYYGSSQKLSEFFKPGDTLIGLEHTDHNNITQNPIYQRMLFAILQSD
ncbi:alpha/beta hydrolase [Robertkochia solimangrovi]|uniref:alpha/beta hydrolase n=1 Tax=Robertkochia solimangrovi TaxID=2213046 RepID=UPI00117EB462|nr:alpha/beta fold hydrolase [Robertkochia solimangrovi]TRZ41991.1 alpha/beta hydrolase [Robertkochia solimangrovi]